MSATKRSAVSILRGLPEVFDLSTFSRMAGVDRENSKTYLSRWTRSELVHPAGPRSGIYFNLIRAPDSPDRLASRALLMAYPSAVLRGASVLHSAGWITQIPHQTTVAVLSRPSYAGLTGFEVSGRPRSWYVVINGKLSKDPNLASYGLPTLTPAQALADSYGQRGGWRPDPDDLYLDDADPKEIVDAFELLGAPIPEFLSSPAFAMG